MIWSERQYYCLKEITDWLLSNSMLNKIMLIKILLNVIINMRQYLDNRKSIFNVTIE